MVALSLFASSHRGRVPAVCMALAHVWILSSNSCVLMLRRLSEPPTASKLAHRARARARVYTHACSLACSVAPAFLVVLMQAEDEIACWAAQANHHGKDTRAHRVRRACYCTSSVCFVSSWACACRVHGARTRLDFEPTVDAAQAEQATHHQ